MPTDPTDPIDPIEPAGPVPLPQLFQADLDDQTLRASLADIEAFATVLGAQSRAGGIPEACPFPEGAAALLDGRISALQVSYRHDGSEWRDTFLRGPSGVRLVRMKVDP